MLDPFATKAVLSQMKPRKGKIVEIEVKGFPQFEDETQYVICVAQEDENGRIRFWSDVNLGLQNLDKIAEKADILHEIFKKEKLTGIEADFISKVQYDPKSLEQNIDLGFMKQRVVRTSNITKQSAIFYMPDHRPRSKNASIRGSSNDVGTVSMMDAIEKMGGHKC